MATPFQQPNSDSFFNEAQNNDWDDRRGSNDTDVSPHGFREKEFSVERFWQHKNGSEICRHRHQLRGEEEEEMPPALCPENAETDARGHKEEFRQDEGRKRDGDKLKQLVAKQLDREIHHDAALKEGQPHPL